jgi:hypothetical protein
MPVPRSTPQPVDCLHLSGLRSFDHNPTEPTPRSTHSSAEGMQAHSQILSCLPSPRCALGWWPARSGFPVNGMPPARQPRPCLAAGSPFLKTSPALHFFLSRNRHRSRYRQLFWARQALFSLRRSAWSKPFNQPARRGHLRREMPARCGHRRAECSSAQPDDGRGECCHLEGANAPRHCTGACGIIGCTRPRTADPACIAPVPVPVAQFTRM